MQQVCPQDVELVPLTRAELDLSDIDSLAYRLEDLIQRYRPDFLVNAAAYTAVDQAESDESGAYAVNALAPGILAMVAAQTNVALLHYSTDYVFDGSKQGPYTETDATNPLSVYGRSKLAGERAIAAAEGRWLVLRTSWVYGEHGGNFLKTMLRLAAERDALKVVDDQTGSPTSARLIARVTFDIIHALRDAQDQDPRWGLYHLTASQSTTWYGYARYLIAQARTLGFTVKVEDSAIEPVASSQFPSAATRPQNSCLDTARLQQIFGLTLPDWQTGVDEVLNRLLNEVHKASR